MTQKNKHTAIRIISDADKDILISKMLECPGQLSDSEITQILEDDELRDIYDISVDLKAAKKSQIALDAEDEWERFQLLMDKSDKTGKPMRPSKFWINLIAFKRITRAAAIFVGLFLVAGAIQMINRNNNSKLEQNNLIAQANETAATEEDQTLDLPTHNTENENETISEEAIKITVNSNSEEEALNGQEVEVKPTPKKESATQSQSRPTKKNQPLVSKSNKQQIAQVSTEIDIEEYLRVQRARMDNDLAMQRAEAVINQYYTMAEMTGEDPTLLTADLNYTVTDMDNNELAALILP